MGIILGIVLGFINLLGSLSVDQKGWPRWLTTSIWVLIGYGIGSLISLAFS